MSARQKGWDREAWLRQLAVPTVTLIVVAIGFYYTQKNNNEKFELTLNKHESQFKEVGNQFERFNETMKKNYVDWMAVNKTEVEKAEKNQKEERETREKMRESFTALFTQLATNSAATNAQVNAIVKTLDGVTTKIDAIQSVQRERDPNFNRAKR